MNRIIFLAFLFLFFFSSIPKCFCNPVDPYHLPSNLQMKIASTNKMLLGKPYNITCIARIPASTGFSLFWINYNDNENITPFNSTTPEKQKSGYAEEVVAQTVLMISRAKRSHEGLYTCLLALNFKDKTKQTFQESAEFYVLEKFRLPKFEPEANYINFGKGHSLTLKCHGISEVLWKKMAMPPVDPFSKQRLDPVRGNQDFHRDPVAAFSYGAILNLDDLTRQDTGNYTCVYKSTIFMDNMDVWEMEANNLIRSNYIFVGDPDILYVETPTILMETRGQPLTVPCRPTFPEVKVFLYKIDDESLMYPRAYDTRVNYSATNGFSVPTFEPYTTKSGYVCIFEFFIYRQKVEFTVLLQPSSTVFVRPTLLGFKPNPEKGTKRTIRCLMPYLRDAQPKTMQWRPYFKTVNTRISPWFSTTYEHYNIMEYRFEFSNITEGNVGVLACAVFGPEEMFSISESYFAFDYKRKSPIITPVGGPQGIRYYAVKAGESLSLQCDSNVPVEWKRSYEDPPEFDVTYENVNFYRRAQNLPTIPDRKVGLREIPILKYKRSYTFTANPDKQGNHFKTTLMLTNLTVENVGTYSCIFVEKNYEKNDLQELTKVHQAATIFIYVEGTNRLDVPSVSKILATKKNPLIIPCVPTNQESTVILLRNGKKVSPSDYLYEEGTGFYFSETKKFNHEAQYKCQYIFRGKQTETSYTVQLIPYPQEIPYPDFKGLFETAQIGSTIKLQCFVKIEKYLPHTLEIIRPGNNLLENKRIHFEKTTTPGPGSDMETNTLVVTIENLKQEDEGNYECHIHDFFGTTRSSFIYVEVIDKINTAPKITGTGIDYDGDDIVELKYIEPCTLKCNLDVKTTWFNETARPKGDVTLEAEYFEKFQEPPKWTLSKLMTYDLQKKQMVDTMQTARVDNNNNLKFEKQYGPYQMTSEDVGYYTCVDDREAALKEKDTKTLIKENKANRVYVFVKDPNMFTYSYSEIKFKKDSDIVVPCRPSHPSVSVNLYKDSIMLPLAEIPFDPKEGFTVNRKFLNPRHNFFICCYERIENGRHLKQHGFVSATYIPEFIEKPILDAEPIKLGSPFDITCSTRVPEDAVVRITWSRYPGKSDKPDPNILISNDKISLHVSDAIIKDLSTSLQVTKANENNLGIYVCRVEDIYGNNRYSMVDVQVYDGTFRPPTVIPENDQFDIAFKCHGDFPVEWRIHSETDRPYGDLTKKVEAFINGESRDNDDTGLALPTPNMMIREMPDAVYFKMKKTEFMDTGYYTCIYKDKIERLNIYHLENSGRATRVYVYTNSPENLKRFKNNKIIYEENTIFTIPCLPTSEAIVVQLLNGPYVIPHHSSYVSYDSETGFTIYNDSFINMNLPIRCSSQRDQLDKQYHDFVLEKITREYKDEEISIEYIGEEKNKQKDMKIAKCRTSLPKNIPYTINWEFPDPSMDIIVENDCVESHLHYECTSLLKIKSFTVEDSGNYTCVRTDWFGKKKTASITLFKVAGRRRPGWKLLYQGTNSKSYCGKSPFTEKTITSPKTIVGQYPWMARIGYHVSPWAQQIHYICGGSLIGSNFVLTAGQCINGPDEMFKTLPVARLGDHQVDGSELFDLPIKYQIIKVAKVMTHASYLDASGKYDIGVLILQHPVELNSWVYPICLTEPKLTSVIYRDNERYKIAGWGTLVKNGPNATGRTLLTGNVDLRPDSSCAGARPVGFCFEGKIYPCQGAAGVPIMWNAETGAKEYYAVGVVSKLASEKCADSIGVAANVSNHIDFILDAVEKLYAAIYKVLP